MSESARYSVRAAGRRLAIVAAAVAVLACALPAFAGAGAPVSPNAIGGLDCNGLSPIQHSIQLSGACTEPRAIYDGQPARFFDNGTYIGHDEPSIRFLSDVPGSANDVTWTETLPMDPMADPTVANPGSDITHWFELSIAPWFGMALCNPYSYPQAA